MGADGTRRPSVLHPQTETPPADDEAVWTFAAEQGLSIVSKDSDFRQRSFVRGHPPKVVWIARGNCSTEETLFAGVLDGGEREVFLGGSRLTRFMESVEHVTAGIPAPIVEEAAVPAAAGPAATEDSAEGDNEAVAPAVATIRANP